MMKLSQAALRVFDVFSCAATLGFKVCGIKVLLIRAAHSAWADWHWKNNSGQGLDFGPMQELHNMTLMVPIPPNGFLTLLVSDPGEGEKLARVVAHFAKINPERNKYISSEGVLELIMAADEEEILAIMEGGEDGQAEDE